MLTYLCSGDKKKEFLTLKNLSIMIAKKIIEDINAQIHAEMWAAQLYLAMSIDARRMGARGMSHWLRKQHEEELQHAYKFIDYLESRNATAELADISGVPATWKCPLEMFEQALEHEQMITRRIEVICRTSLNEGDFATFQFLQYFLGEQVEEESWAMEMVDMLKCLGNDTAALYAFDNTLLDRK